jgi:protein O-mannosyl-transferase
VSSYTLASDVANSRERVWGIPVTYLLTCVLALTALGYISTLSFPFVYDDEAQIVGNQLIEKWHYVPYYFGISVWAHVNPHQAGQYYRPIFMLWMRLNQALFGFHPFGWHLVSVAMHVLATFFVFRLARRLTGRNHIAIIAAAIFGLHPAHVETVAWVSGATDSLLAILLIPSLLFFLNWRENRPNARAWCLLLYALALFSKETAVLTMPFVFVYCWLYPRDQNSSLLGRFWKALLPTLPFVAITLFYFYLRILVLHALLYELHPLSLRTHLLTVPSILWFYIRILVWPVGLSAFYHTPYITQPTFSQFWLPLAGVILVAVAIFYWWWKTRDREIVVAAALLVFPLLPLMKFTVFIEGEIAHDRYLYLPSIGFAILMAKAISGIAARFAAGHKALRAELVTTAVVSVTLLGLTIWQSQFWANNLVLYYRGLEIAPQNLLVVNNLANEFEHRKMYPQAISEYFKVLERDPNFYLANYNLGYVFYETGDYKQGAHFLKRAAALDNTDAGTFYYIAICNMKLGEVKEAEENLRRAINVDPRLVGPRYKLGELLKQQGRNAEALLYFKAELEKAPTDEKVRAAVQELQGK